MAATTYARRKAKTCSHKPAINTRDLWVPAREIGPPQSREQTATTKKKIISVDVKYQFLTDEPLNAAASFFGVWGETLQKHVKAPRRELSRTSGLMND